MGKSVKLLKTFVAGIKAFGSPSKEKCEKREYAAHAGSNQQKRGRKEKCPWSLGKSTSRKCASLTAGAALGTKSVEDETAWVKEVNYSLASETTYQPLNGLRPTKLHTGPVSHVNQEAWAATKIQAAFRRYLAQRAFHALQALVKLQALARGWIVRKHASTSLRCMQALIKVQAHARGHHVRTSELGQLVQRHLQQIKHQKRKPTEGWVSSMATLQQLQAKAQSKQDGVVKRQRAMVYALSGQLNRSAVKAIPLPVADYEPDKSYWVWIWLERWTAVHPWGNVTKEQTKGMKKLKSNVDAERSISKSEKRIMSVNESAPSLQSRCTSSNIPVDDDIPHLQELPEPAKEEERHIHAWKVEEQVQLSTDVDGDKKGAGASSNFVQVEKPLGNISVIQRFLASPTPPPPPPPPMVQRLLPSCLGPPVVQGLSSTPKPPSPQVKTDSKVVDNTVISLQRSCPIPPASPPPPPPPPPVARKFSRSPSPPAPPPPPPGVAWKPSSSPSAVPPSPLLMENISNPLVHVPNQTSSSSQKCSSLGIDIAVKPCSKSSTASNSNHQSSSTSESLPSASLTNPVMDLSLSRSSLSSCIQSSEGSITTGALESYFKPLATSFENAASITASVTQELPHAQLDFPTDPIISNPFSSVITFATDMHSPSQLASFPPSTTLTPSLYSPRHATLSNTVLSKELSSPPHKHAITCLLLSIPAEESVDVSYGACTSGQNEPIVQIASTNAVSKEPVSDLDEGEKTIGIIDSGYAVLLNDSDLQAAQSDTNERCDAPDVSHGGESTQTLPNTHSANSVSGHEQLAETVAPSVRSYMATTKSSKAKIRTVASPRQKPDSPKLKLDSPKEKVETTKQKLESPKQKLESPVQKLESTKQKSVSPIPESTTKRRHSLSALEGKSSAGMQKASRHVRAGSKNQIASLRDTSTENSSRANGN